MGEQGIAAYGTTFSWGGHDVAELTSIGGPRISVDTIDVSSHDSGVDAFREFVAGMGDAGEISLEGNFYPGDTLGQRALVDDMIGRERREMIITFPDGTTFTCKALVTAFEPSAPFDDRLSFSATVKLTGEPDFGVDLAEELTGLTMVGATFLPAFAGTTYDYVADATTENPTITPECVAADYITVNGNVVVSGFPYALDAGIACTITYIVVKTHEAGKSARTYRLTMHRSA